VFGTIGEIAFFEELFEGKWKYRSARNLPAVAATAHSY